jgi:glutamyl-Q tRNA(Asp) synthetase
MSDQQPSAHRPRPSQYRGRFAPSPTGPLHFGSLIAATGSYLQAKQARGQWLVRIEDLDPPRAVPRAADLILRTLETFGFEWDKSVLFQGTRTPAYEYALDTLRSQGLSYPCSCSRSELQALNVGMPGNNDELYYPGRCRQGPIRAQEPYAWRFRVPGEPICFLDQLQGSHCVNLQTAIGDFVIKRRDGWFAYQLAVVVDDAEQGITEVVRGTDLLFNTPRQIALQRALGTPPPAYMHLPLAVDPLGRKLAKSNAAAPVDADNAARALWRALRFLRQPIPDELQVAAVSSLWNWAITHWDATRLKNISRIEVG